MTKILVPFAAFFLALALTSIGVQPALPPMKTVTDALRLERSRYVGIKGARVSIVPMDPYHFGPTPEEIQTQVELRMRRNGLKVYDENEWRATEDLPLLMVGVIVIPHEKTRLIAYEVKSTLDQKACFPRSQGKYAMATTWAKSDFSLTSGTGFRAEVVQKIDTLIDDFCNEILSAKPYVPNNGVP